MAVITALKWIPVESEVFAAAAYRDSARQLYLRFRGGDIYRYFECPVAQYQAFLAAESKGRCFSQQIRNRFQDELVYRNEGRDSEWQNLEEQLSRSVLLAKARGIQKSDAAHTAGVQESMR
jgi:KTSC domain